MPSCRAASKALFHIAYVPAGEVTNATRPATRTNQTAAAAQRDENACDDEFAALHHCEIGVVSATGVNPDGRRFAACSRTHEFHSPNIDFA